METYFTVPADQVRYLPKRELIRARAKDEKHALFLSEYERVPPGAELVVRVTDDGPEPVALLLHPTPHRRATAIAMARQKLTAPVPDPLVRLSDLITQEGIATKVHKSSPHVGRLTHHPTFPRPLGKVGLSRVWYWPEVRTWWKTYRKPIERRSKGGGKSAKHEGQAEE